jgi:hypothetical protein
MDTAAADRFRETGLDDAGNSLHRKLADHPAPCRHCLTDAVQGEPVLLGSYHFGRPKGIYWTPSPVFVHATPSTPLRHLAPTVGPAAQNDRAATRGIIAREFDVVFLALFLPQSSPIQPTRNYPRKFWPGQLLKLAVGKEIGAHQLSPRAS